MAQQTGSQQSGQQQSGSQQSGQQKGSQGIEVKGRQQGGMSRREPWGNWLSSRTSSPFGMMRRMFDDLDQMFGGGLMGMSPWMEQSMTTGAGWMPAIELIERGNDMVLIAELPGCKRDDINIRVKDGMLTLEGERRSEHEDKREGMIHSERSYGRFMRSMSLPQDIDPNGIRASFKDGILEIAMPRSGDTGARQIEIGEGEGMGAIKH